MTEDQHRRFGVECNNATWDVLASGGPGPDATRDELDLVLYRAYASAFHWMESPSATGANRVRAEHLVARTAVAVGLPRVAMRHAERCLELCGEHAEAIEDWDLAFAHEALARAAAAGGDTEGAARHHAEAARLGAAIADDGDREVFLSELARGPWFGLAV